MGFRYGGIVAGERLHSKHVEGDGMIGPNPQSRLGLRDNVRSPTLLLRLRGAGEMLLGGHVHEVR